MFASRATTLPPVPSVLPYRQLGGSFVYHRLTARVSHVSRGHCRGHPGHPGSYSGLRRGARRGRQRSKVLLSDARAIAPSSSCRLGGGQDRHTNRPSATLARPAPTPTRPAPRSSPPARPRPKAPDPDPEDTAQPITVQPRKVSLLSGAVAGEEPAAYRL